MTGKKANQRTTQTSTEKRTKNVKAQTDGGVQELHVQSSREVDGHSPPTLARPNDRKGEVQQTQQASREAFSAGVRATAISPRLYWLTRKIETVQVTLIFITLLTIGSTFMNAVLFYALMNYRF